MKYGAWSMNVGSKHAAQIVYNTKLPNASLRWSSRMVNKSVKYMYVRFRDGPWFVKISFCICIRILFVCGTGNNNNIRVILPAKQRLKQLRWYKQKQYNIRDCNYCKVVLFTSLVIYVLRSPTFNSNLWVQYFSQS